MAKNFIQPGNTVDLVAPADVLSGGVVHVGAFLGVAAYDAKSGVTVPVQLTGVFELPKVAGQTINPGDRCYWSLGHQAVSSVNASSDPLMGAATETSIGSATTVRVRLKGTAGLDTDD